MTTYLNTSLETYNQFAELSKKMAEDFLKAYKLHNEDSVRIEKDEHNGDELIINPENEAGVTAYVEIEERINVEELYKNVIMSLTLKKNSKKTGIKLLKKKAALQQMSTKRSSTLPKKTLKTSHSSLNVMQKY